MTAFSNPFSTRFVEPGAIPFYFRPEDPSIETIMAYLERSGSRAQMIAPHGAGKSTLLATLFPLLETRYGVVRQFTLHDNQRRLHRPLPPETGMIVIDGFEQLAWMEKLRVFFHSRHLLITAHRRFPGLSLLPFPHPDPDRFIAIVRENLHVAPEMIDDAELMSAYFRNAADLRATFFELYDLLESRYGASDKNSDRADRPKARESRP